MKEVKKEEEPENEMRKAQSDIVDSVPPKQEIKQTEEINLLDLWSVGYQSCTISLMSHNSFKKLIKFSWGDLFTELFPSFQPFQHLFFFLFFDVLAVYMLNLNKKSTFEDLAYYLRLKKLTIFCEAVQKGRVRIAYRKMLQEIKHTWSQTQIWKVTDLFACTEPEERCHYVVKSAALKVP